MPVDILLGLQWGDEGKGKIVDYIAPTYQVVARFQGGPNAGHTLVIHQVKHVLHQIPSGIFNPEAINVIGNGVVLDVAILQKEAAALLAKGLQVQDNLYVSSRAQLILPTHRLLDAAIELHKGERKIGSTLKGIGPTYQDKYARNGLRVGDVLSGEFEAKYKELKNVHLKLLDQFDFLFLDKLPTLEEEFFKGLEFLKSLHITQTEYLLASHLDKGHRILAEGAQGSLLDVDFGSYPYVTSSNTIASGASSGLGIGPKHIGEVMGLFKAYCTRVGEGPFPTELHDETGEKLRKEGHEFGATTGRPRRCGWLDLPALKYAVMINSATQLIMMKADVLNIFDEIKVCTHYRLPNGEVTGQLPFCLEKSKPEPVYTILPGWGDALMQADSWETLPGNLLNYMAFIEEHVGVPITIVSTGPDRSQTILKQ